MKNTSIFIPILLIGCLAALIYLFFAALSAVEENDDKQPDRIVLNEEDYRPPGTADPDAFEVKADDKDSYDTYFEEVPEDEKVLPKSSTSTGTETSEDTDWPSRESAVNDSPASSPSTSHTTVAPPATNDGRYLVLAGSFVQEAGADTRVAALRAAGFRDARTERFNRGTYAVALAGQFDSYARAKRLADQLTAKGFESEVMKRR